MTLILSFNQLPKRLHLEDEEDSEGRKGAGSETIGSISLESDGVAAGIAWIPESDLTPSLLYDDANG